MERQQTLLEIIWVTMNGSNGKILKALFKIKEEGGTFENTKNKTERK